MGILLIFPNIPHPDYKSINPSHWVWNRVNWGFFKTKYGLPKTNACDNEGRTGVLRPHETGWVVTSGNISTSSDFGKFPVDPFHHQLSPLSLSPGGSQPRATSVQLPCNIRVLLGWNPPQLGSNPLKKVYFWGCFGVWGDGVGPRSSTDRIEVS